MLQIKRESYCTSNGIECLTKDEIKQLLRNKDWTIEDLKSEISNIDNEASETENQFQSYDGENKDFEGDLMSDADMLFDYLKDLKEVLKEIERR